MHSAPHFETAELSESDLDNVSGGLAPHVEVVAGSMVVSDSSLLAQADAAQGQVQGTLGQFHQVGVSASF